MSPAAPRIIGIIGPPCSGKSTVAKILQSRGGVWINADLIAKEQLTHPDVIAELVECFGETIRQSDGVLSRAAIANLVFGDDATSRDRLKQLESIVHPRTRTEIERQIQAATYDHAELIVLDVPLLIESGWYARCDEIWCVKINPVRQAELLAARGWDAAELARRDGRQLPWSEKERLSTRVIQNDGTLADLSAQLSGV